MSRFTTEVRYICDFYSGMEESGDYTDIDERIENAQSHIFGNYPIFDETYRSLLNKKILRHYYTREISEETIGLWKLRLNNRMNEIMPYYNQLYTSELLQFNPFYDVDLKTTSTRANDQDSSGSSSSETNRENNYNRNEQRSVEEERTNETNNERNVNGGSGGSSTSERSGNNDRDNSEKINNTSSTVNGRNNVDKYSDTPQGQIANLDDGYLTNARIIDEETNENRNDNSNRSANETNNFLEKSEDNTSNFNYEKENATGAETGKRNEINAGTQNGKETGSDTTSSEDNSHINSLENYAETVYGKRGGQSYMELLKEFRETFLNIDKMIIDELSDLFFGLWE